MVDLIELDTMRMFNHIQDLFVRRCIYAFISFKFFSPEAFASMIYIPWKCYALLSLFNQKIGPGISFGGLIQRTMLRRHGRFRCRLFLFT